MQGPLAGTTVVDLTRILSGPYCTMMLADLGARVIKVERPEGGDDARSIGPFAAGGSAYFASINRGKESIGLDLREPADRTLFDALLGRADVLVENFRPGALDKLGYAWEGLHARWPRLVVVSISGFGQTGPLRERPAYDMVVQAMGGVMSITGEPGGRPTRVGTSIGDIAAGMFAAYGCVAALYERTRTGVGARVDVSMLDGQVALLENAIARFVTTGDVPGPIGSRHPSITPFGVFQARDASLVVAAGNDPLFGRLCEALGAPGLAADDVEGWLERLSRAGIPCAPVQNVAQVLEHAQVRARHMVLPIDDPSYRGVVVAGNPVKISTLPERASAAPPPALGQHRESILRELGLA
jgi:CoA:oxalate CoA-transferase